MKNVKTTCRFLAIVVVVVVVVIDCPVPAVQSGLMLVQDEVSNTAIASESWCGGGVFSAVFLFALHIPGNIVEPPLYMTLHVV